MSKRQRPSYEANPLNGTKQRPATWGKCLQFNFAAGDHWATPIVLDVDPIDQVTFAGGSRTNMVILSGTYALGKYSWNANEAGPWDTVIFCITTSVFDVANNEDKSPLQMLTDSDVFFRGSSEPYSESVLERDMEILPPGSEIVLVTPVIYVYAWRGNNSMKATAGAGVGVGEVLANFKLAYYMTNLAAQNKLDKYIQTTNNSGFLEITPAS